MRSMKSRANPPVPNLLYNGWVTRWVPGALRHFQLNAPKRSSTKFFGRIQERSLPYWADPAQTQADDGGRGFYFEDPNGHFLEVITRRMLKPGRR
jgi:hypothetical protein